MWRMNRGRCKDQDTNRAQTYLYDKTSSKYKRKSVLLQEECQGLDKRATHIFCSKREKPPQIPEGWTKSAKFIAHRSRRETAIEPIK